MTGCGAPTHLHQGVHLVRDSGNNGTRAVDDEAHQRGDRLLLAHVQEEAIGQLQREGRGVREKEGVGWGELRKARTSGSVEVAD